MINTCLLWTKREVGSTEDFSSSGQRSGRRKPCLSWWTWWLACVDLCFYSPWFFTYLRYFKLFFYKPHKEYVTYCKDTWASPQTNGVNICDFVLFLILVMDAVWAENTVWQSNEWWQIPSGRLARDRDHSSQQHGGCVQVGSSASSSPTPPTHIPVSFHYVLTCVCLL